MQQGYWAGKQKLHIDLWRLAALTKSHSLELSLRFSFLFLSFLFFVLELYGCIILMDFFSCKFNIAGRTVSALHLGFQMPITLSKVFQSPIFSCLGGDVSNYAHLLVH